MTLIDVEALANIAADVGINAEQAKAFLLSNEGIQEIRELERQAIALNLHMAQVGLVKIQLLYNRLRESIHSGVSAAFQSRPLNIPPEFRNGMVI
jgi:hypothetical protein